MNSKAIVKHIVTWLNHYAENAGSNGFVVGVSGGIDSAVTSALVARTTKPVICLEMPVRPATSPVSTARNHIAQLKHHFPNISFVRTDLTPVFESFVNTLPVVTNDTQHMLALSNTRARLRMTTLYYFAGLHGCLVVGTGNKVEDFGVGFFTKYGDGGVDLSPIADLNKTEVYKLGQELEVSEEIMLASPTDGLWEDGRSDEDQLGASYQELEWAMEFQAQHETSLNTRQKEVLERYNTLHQTNQHKIKPIPVCEIPISLK